MTTENAPPAQNPEPTTPPAAGPPEPTPASSPPPAPTPRDPAPPPSAVIVENATQTEREVELEALLANERAARIEREKRINDLEDENRSLKTPPARPPQDRPPQERRHPARRFGPVIRMED